MLGTVETTGRYETAGFKKSGWSTTRKCCCFFCCFFAIVLITVGVLIAFLVRIPSVAVTSTSTNCPNAADLAGCAALAQSEGVDFTVVLTVSNPNIIGADISSNEIALLDNEAGTPAFGSKLTSAPVAQVHIAKQGDTQVTMTFKLRSPQADPLISARVFPPPHRPYRIRVVGTVDIALGSLSKGLDIDESVTLS